MQVPGAVGGVRERRRVPAWILNTREVARAVVVVVGDCPSRVGRGVELTARVVGIAIGVAATPGRTRRTGEADPGDVAAGVAEVDRASCLGDRAWPDVR